MKKISIILIIAMVLAISAGALAACGGEKYDLVYASWNLSTEQVNNIERQMIKAFEEKYDVKVKIEENINLGEGYDDSIINLAGRDSMPDVVMLSNINFGLEHRFVTDISDLVANDPDWDKIPKPIEEAVHFKTETKDGIYAIPFAMHMMGYFANVDLITQCNMDKKLSGDFTYDNFFDIVKGIAETYKSQGIIGLSHENTIFEWYPASVNQDYGWFTWDGSQYHLDSQEFLDAMEKTSIMHANNYTYNSLTNEERAAYFEGVDGYVELWNQGNLALRWGATYELPNMIEGSGGSFEIQFLGVPGGRTPIVGDYLSISPTCENKELAYKFAKWMSFDPEGMLTRIEKTKSTEVPNTLPLTTDETIINAYFDKFDSVKGLVEMYEHLDNGIVECVKVVPGYNRARQTAKTGIDVTTPDGKLQNCPMGNFLDCCWNGYFTYADRAKEVNELANKQYQTAISKYIDYYK